MLVYLLQPHQHGKVGIVGQGRCDWEAGYYEKFLYILQSI